MLTKVDHIDVKVKNFDETVELFSKMGFVEKRRTPPPRLSVEMALPGEGQVVFEIHKAIDGGFEGIHHIAFKQAGPGTVETLKAMGISFSTENKLIADTGRIISSFKDGNGLTWQLTD
jgi:catechol 2,3-dioxygenase-like lactoylglutathione lyase family enzyme